MKLDHKSLHTVTKDYKMLSRISVTITRTIISVQQVGHINTNSETTLGTSWFYDGSLPKVQGKKFHKNSVPQEQKPTKIFLVFCLPTISLQKTDWPYQKMSHY